MLTFFKNSPILRRFLAALFVFSAVMTAGTVESHRDNEAAKHASHLSAEDAGATGIGSLTQTPVKQNGNHANHCTFDALCVTGGAWLVSGHNAVMPVVHDSGARYVPRTALLEGLRPRPKLRPPRHDS